MALTPQNNEAFLREVDEELRRDQLAGFWERHGRLVLIAIVTGLAIFAGVLYWGHHQRVIAGEQGEQLATAYEALGNEQPAKAQRPLQALATSSSDGYRTLALFTQADILLQKNDLKGAAAKFAQVSQDEGVAKPFRDLATVRRTAAEYDSLKPQVVVERLQPLATPGSPWLGSAGEMLAAAQLRLGRRDRAGQLFGEIARDPNVPESLRQRAVQMAGVLGVDAVAQKDGAR